MQTHGEDKRNEVKLELLPSICGGRHQGSCSSIGKAIVFFQLLKMVWFRSSVLLPLSRLRCSSLLKKVYGNEQLAAVRATLDTMQIIAIGNRVK